MKNAENPSISVIMACFNEEKSLSRAIESILNQTFTDFEFIIIDDGSTDGSSKIVEAFAQRDARIVVAPNDSNRGLTFSLNKGLALAKADIIARMDADDESLPERLEKQYHFLMNHPSVGVLGTGAFLESKSDGRSLGVHFLPEKHEDILKLMYKNTFVYHPSVLARKQLLLEANGYNPKAYRSEDTDLWYRLADKTQFHNLQEPLIRYAKKSDWTYREFKGFLATCWRNMTLRHEKASHLHILFRITALFIAKKFIQFSANCFLSR